MEKLDLIQTHYEDDPWKIMISCIMLNQTSNVQVRPVIKRFFEAFPTPNSLNESHQNLISAILQPTGFQNVKAKRIINFTKVWNSGERDPNKFPGIGPYAKDSWKIFIEGKTNFHPADKKLSAYLRQLNS